MPNVPGQHVMHGCSQVLGFSEYVLLTVTNSISAVKMLLSCKSWACTSSVNENADIPLLKMAGAAGDMIVI